MKVKELLNLYSESYGVANVAIDYDEEPFDEERHGDLTVRYFYPDHDITIHDGIIVIEDKIVIITD